MIKNSLVGLILLFSILFISEIAFSQSKNLKKAEKELRETRALLTNLTKKSSATYLRFQLLERQIKLQQNLLKNIKTDIDSLDTLINLNSNRKKELSKQIIRLKGEYEELILYAYKTRNTRNKTIYIFSAKTFNQAYRRFIYLQYLTEYLEQTTTDLLTKSDSLNFINKSLRIQKEEKLNLKEKQTDELLKLNDPKKVLSNILDNLNTQKEFLLAEIKEKERVATSLRESIKKNIESSGPATKTTLSVNFENNKGSLPFPINGVVSSSFGKHTHSVLKNVMVENDGIEIATNEGAKAKSIHPGVVSQVLKIPGAYNAVIIKHGQYYTVYSNLADVYVSKGDNLSTGQEIGFPESRILNFQIWFQNKKLNPQLWLKM